MHHKRLPFEIVYDPEIATHLAAIERKHYSLIRDTVQQQLHYQPLVETRNRKPLRRPSAFGTAWELRFGSRNRFRVFYRVNVPEHTVHIIAIGVKIDNRLYISGEEFKL